MPLCDAANDFVQGLNQKFANTEYVFEATSGRKYDKITTQIAHVPHSKRVFAFVEKQTGGVYKPATYAAPAKQERYATVTHALEHADINGSFLYFR